MLQVFFLVLSVLIFYLGSVVASYCELMDANCLVLKYARFCVVYVTGELSPA